MKKRIILLLLLISVFLLKNRIFNYCVSYEKINSVHYEYHNWGKENNIENEKLNLEMIINKSLDLTDKLSFSYKNDLLHNRANCIGYSLLFSNYFNYLSSKNNLPYKAYHIRGLIYVFNVNINNYFSDPFFKDHDYIEIHNSETKESIYIDPVLYSYLNIKYINNR